MEIFINLEILISFDFPCYLKYMIHKLYGGLKIQKNKVNKKEKDTEENKVPFQYKG